MTTLTATFNFTNGKGRLESAFRDEPVFIQVGGRHTLRSVERAHVETVVKHSKTRKEAASVLGINKATLYRKMKRNNV